MSFRMMLFCCVAACSSKRTPPERGSASPVPVVAHSIDAAPAPAPDAAVVARCDAPADCKGPEHCSFDCVDHQCRISGLTATEGASPCFGDQLDTAQLIHRPTDPTSVVLACDVNAGLRCDLAMHRCVKGRALGEHCGGPMECANGNCDNGTCVARNAIGKACGVDQDFCAAGAFCDQTRHCRARPGENGICESSEDCSPGFACEGMSPGHCKPDSAPKCSLVP